MTLQKTHEVNSSMKKKLNGKCQFPDKDDIKRARKFIFFAAPYADAEYHKQIIVKGNNL